MGKVDERVRVRTGAAGLAPVEGADSVDVGGLKFEIEQLEVLPHPRGRHRLREHDVATLEVPAQHYLRRRLANLVSQLRDGGLTKHLALRDRRPRLNGDPVLPAVGTYRVVGEIRMDLDLVHRGHQIGVGCQSLQVLNREVRYPNRAGAAIAVELLERLPGRDKVAAVEGGQGPVDQEQVDVVEAQFGKGSAEGLAGIFRPVRRVVERVDFPFYGLNR